MPRLPWPLLALALPLAEIAGFVIVGRWLGVFATLVLVLAAMASGMAILRGRGAALRRGLQPDAMGAVADEALLAFAAMLLIVPGFLTDLLALPLLVPGLRRRLVAALASRVGVGTAGFGVGPQTTVIDGEFIELESAPHDPQRPPSGWTRH